MFELISQRSITVIFFHDKFIKYQSKKMIYSSSALRKIPATICL
jgi:hypothetical protein